MSLKKPNNYRLFNKNYKKIPFMVLALFTQVLVTLLLPSTPLYAGGSDKTYYFTHGVAFPLADPNAVQGLTCSFTNASIPGLPDESKGKNR